MSTHAEPLAHLLANIPLALTYDDVLLLPAYSEVLPHEASPAVTLAPGLTLPVPMMSAAMDTVTEAPLATAMARAGGLGVLHKNLAIDAQADQVRAVREAGHIGSPTPCLDPQGLLAVAAAVGVGPQGLERAEALVRAQVSLLVVDTAHGHTQGVLTAVRELRRRYPHVPVAAGNVATAAGTRALIEAGAQIIKVGIGPGSICTTRSVSGVGVPQLTAVMACAEAAQGSEACIVADGGIQGSGDIVKALAAGAHAIMLGSMLAGCAEAPGEIFEHEGVQLRRYRGMGSAGAMQAGSADRYFQGPTTGSSRKLVPEGVAAAVPVTGPIADTLAALEGGLRAGMGYLGAQNLVALRHNAHFVRQTPAGLRESLVHDVARIP